MNSSRCPQKKKSIFNCQRAKAGKNKKRIGSEFFSKYFQPVKSYLFSTQQDAAWTFPRIKAGSNKKPSLLAHRKAQMALFGLLRIANLNFIAESKKSLTQNITAHSS